MCNRIGEYLIFWILNRGNNGDKNNDDNYIILIFNQMNTLVEEDSYETSKWTAAE